MADAVATFQEERSTRSVNHVQLATKNIHYARYIQQV